MLLIHGYAETSPMWKPLAQVLAPRFTVIAPDLSGIGDSSISASDIAIKKSAERVHAAAHALGYAKVRVVGHDIGLMVAYAHAALYPQGVEKLALMDAFPPGVAGWEAVYNNPAVGQSVSTGRRRRSLCAAAPAKTKGPGDHDPFPAKPPSRRPWRP